MIRIMGTVIFLLCSVQMFSGDFEREEVQFESRGASLSGTIVSPGVGKPHAAVVFVHGSGRQGRSLPLAELLAKDGIATLVYDKRGVGRSEGSFEGKNPVSETNIDLLAADAAAALSFLSTHPSTKTVPLGFTGLSQAGWIVPLAVEKATDAAFFVLWSGPVCKVSEEDIFSKYTSDKDQKIIPSYSEALSSRTEPFVWPEFLGRDTDPSDNLARIQIPGMWVFGGRDGSVPVDLSIQRLTRLIEAGHDYEYVLFSNLGHNNIADSSTIVTDWIKRQARN